MKFYDGNLLKTISSYVYDEKGYWKNENINSNVFFIKTDYIDDFIKTYKPTYPYKIITHNSDLPITKQHLSYLNDHNLLYWFAQTIDVNHSKLKHIPAGLPNERVINEGQLEHFNFGARK